MFTKKSQQVDRLISEDLNLISKEIKKKIPKSKIILWGSFFYDDFSYIKKKRQIVFMSDYDLFVVTNNFLPIFKTIKLKRNLEKISEQLNNNKLDVIITSKILSNFNLQRKVRFGKIINENKKHHSKNNNSFRKIDLLYNFEKLYYKLLLTKKHAEDYHKKYVLSSIVRYAFMNFCIFNNKPFYSSSEILDFTQKDKIKNDKKLISILKKALRIRSNLEKEETISWLETRFALNKIFNLITGLKNLKSITKKISFLDKTVLRLQITFYYLTNERKIIFFPIQKYENWLEKLDKAVNYESKQATNQTVSQIKKEMIKRRNPFFIKIKN